MSSHSIRRCVTVASSTELTFGFGAGFSSSSSAASAGAAAAGVSCASTDTSSVQHNRVEHLDCPPADPCPPGTVPPRQRTHVVSATCMALQTPRHGCTSNCGRPGAQPALQRRIQSQAPLASEPPSSSLPSSSPPSSGLQRDAQHSLSTSSRGRCMTGCKTHRNGKLRVCGCLAARKVAHRKLGTHAAICS